MNRSLRRYVVKRQAPIVFVDDLRRNFFVDDSLKDCFSRPCVQTRRCSFVVEFVPELSERNRFVAHQDRNAFDDRIHHVAVSSRQAAVDSMLHNLPAAIPQAAARE